MILYSKERLEYLNEHFENQAILEIKLEFVFTKCYKEGTDGQREELVVDEAFEQEIQTLKLQYDYSDTQTNNLGLSHGDLYHGSVMVQIHSKRSEKKSSYHCSKLHGATSSR